MADQEEQRARRRLFQHLEQRIGCFRVFELVGAVDQADPPAPLACRRAEEAHDAPDLVDRDDGAQRPGIAGHALQHEEIGMGIAGDAPHRRVRGIERERGGGLDRGGRAGPDGRARSAPSGRRASPCRCRLRRRSARHAESGRCGSSKGTPARPPDGRTGRWSPAAAGRPGSVSVSLSRCADVPLGPLVRRPAHNSSSTERGADSGARRFFTCIQMSAATWSLVRLALISTQRCGSSLAMSRNAALSRS